MTNPLKKAGGGIRTHDGGIPIYKIGAVGLYATPANKTSTGGEIRTPTKSFGDFYATITSHL
jgi:hypothetical protein